MPKRPKIAALAPWAGGKRSIAHHIIGLLGEHTAYFEPFAGSMAVLMAKEPAAVELANDLDDDVVNVALCLQDRLMRRRLLYRLDNTLCHERLFAEAAHRMADPGACSRGGRFSRLRRPGRRGRVEADRESGRRAGPGGNSGAGCVTGCR